MSKITLVFVITAVLTFAKSQSTWKGSNQLHPVHGLYVKPSVDGTTGDLYVAATEDSGTKTQWLTDQPINFLPVGAATQQVPTAVAYNPSYSASTHDESQSTKKRAVITTPPVQYAYALPISGATEGALPYPYAIPAVTSTTQGASTSSETSSTPQCTDTTAAAVPYNPFHFFYPHMMSAYANAKSILKESGMSDDSAGAVVSQASPMWSPYGAYPMYVMVDPNAWAQAHVAQTSASNTSSSES